MIGPLPLNSPPPPLHLSPTLASFLKSNVIPDEFVKLAAEMPEKTREVLLYNELSDDIEEVGDGASASLAHQIINELNLPAHILAESLIGLSSNSIDNLPNILSPSSCGVLRDMVDKNWQEEADSVDGGPDCQLKLSLASLLTVLGSHSTTEASRLCNTIESYKASAEDEVRIIIRKYTTSGRPWIPFHCDSSGMTLNISLSEEDEYKGGELLALTNGKVTRVGRRIGEGNVHDSRVLHGVSRMISGARYSLIIFVGIASARREDLMFGNGRPTREDEVDKFILLCEDAKCYEEIVNSRRENSCTTSVVSDAINIKRCRNYPKLGHLIEKLIVKYDAPHLRPTNIITRPKEQAAWSFRQLVSYLNKAIDCE